MANLQELIEFNIMSLTKTQLQEKAKEIQEALKQNVERNEDMSKVGYLLARFEALEKKDEENVNEITQLKKENKHLLLRLKEIDEDLEYAEERFIEKEKTLIRCEQYTRRENFEISGIPDTLPAAELEEKVINIINSVTAKDGDCLVTAKDIHACHRLRKEKDDDNAKVIVRMVNRKDTLDVLRNKKKLMDKSTELSLQNLFINENLSSGTKKLPDP